MSKAQSIGIIGGADGPTTIFITGGFPWEVVFLFVLCIGAAMWFLMQKK